MRRFLELLVASFIGGCVSILALLAVDEIFKD